MAAATAPPRVSGTYRKLPALTWTTQPNLSQAGKEGRCARVTGHTLVVLGDVIKCQSCGSVWRDQGF
jgi:hypothetical protein